MSPAAPVRARVRMYRVGFGDATLLTLEYAKPDADGRTERHLLFDCGTTRPSPFQSDGLAGVAELIRQHTGGQLDVLVITHRHRDHLSGFGDKKSAPILAALKPRLVLRPWTEDPGLTDDAVAVTTDESHRAFAAGLRDAQQMVEILAGIATGRSAAMRELAAAAAEQLPNRAAIETLAALAADGRGRYLHAGSRLALASVVPGLRVTVLGPPTLKQAPGVSKQASRDPEYWMFCLRQAMLALPAAPLAPGGAQLGPDVANEVPPGPARWLIERLRSHRTQSMLRLIRSLDDALNNTSLILLLEVGNLRLLFPGDAQIENWRYTLGRLAANRSLRDKLTKVDLYKVGHHGSRNATPISLHGLWTARPAGAPPLVSVMSTLPGVHGRTVATAVPRQTLVDALASAGTLYRTDDLPEAAPYIELVSDTASGPFLPVGD